MASLCDRLIVLVDEDRNIADLIVSGTAVRSKREKIIDGMKCYTPDEIEKALKSAGFSKVKTNHHASKPWITVLAQK